MTTNGSPRNEESAYAAYRARFEQHFGARDPGAFVKFNRHMVQFLTAAEFTERLTTYLQWRTECEKALMSGATISDVLVMEFEEAAAWIAITAPNMLRMFDGEFGDPAIALGTLAPDL